MRAQQFADFFTHAPPGVDCDSIRRQWLALSPPYDVNDWQLPLPVWSHRDFDHIGTDAWQFLSRNLENASAHTPFCIYLHIPFCSSKCHFCDCYSFKLGNHWAEHIEKYVSQLCNELRLWSAQGNLAERPISTVHLGGGTPTFLGAKALRRLAACCRENFHITSNTEWALESTVESLTPEMIRTMHELEFRRLHIGVQSLEEKVRRAIKRRRSVAEVLAKIDEVLERGWTVSVDMVCGLPGQTLNGFMADIEKLIALGIHGVSLYELLIYPQNRKWAEAQGLVGRDHAPNYFLFQAAAGRLETAGLRKNLFNHWATATDQNVYFTFPVRGEDCLAAGTIADGVFGEYHYRHLRYGAYLQTAQAGTPGLQGVLRRTIVETALLPLTTAILSGNISPQQLPTLQSMQWGRAALLSYWLEMALIQASARGGYDLTSNGSWFAGNMVRDLMRAAITIEGG